MVKVSKVLKVLLVQIQDASRPGPFCHSLPRSVGPTLFLPTPCQNTTRICAPKPNDLHLAFTLARLHFVAPEAKARLGCVRSLFDSSNRVCAGPLCHSPRRSVGPAPFLPSPRRNTTRICAHAQQSSLCPRPGHAALRDLGDQYTA